MKNLSYSHERLRSLQFLKKLKLTTIYSHVHLQTIHRGQFEDYGYINAFLAQIYSFF